MGVLELKIHCAEDLKDVRTVATMHPYVVASIESSGVSFGENERAAKVKTPPDNSKGGVNPSWECSLRLPLAGRRTAADFKDAFLLLQIYDDSSLLPTGPTRVGSTLVPFSHITANRDPATGQPLCFTGTWQQSKSRVQRPSGRYQGFITFSVRINSEDPTLKRGPSHYLRKDLADSSGHIEPSSTPGVSSSSGPQGSYMSPSGMAAGYVLGAVATEAAFDMD